VRTLGFALAALVLLAALPDADARNRARGFTRQKESAGVLIPPAIDAVVTPPTFNISSGSETSWSHTVSGLDRILVVYSGARHLGAGNWSVSINGTLATQAILTQNTSTVAGIWYRTNPPTGVNTIKMQASTTTRGAAASISYTGVDTAGPIRTTVGATGTSSPATLNLSATAQDLVVDVVGAKPNGTTLTVITNTQQWNTAFSGAPPDQYGVAAGSDAVSSGAATTMSWTVGGGDEWAQSAFALIPVP
jgi:hypothetical protein